MSLDSDVIVDRRRIRRKLTFWRVVAVVVAIAAIVTLGLVATPGGRASLTSSGSIEFEPAIRELLREYPSMPATVIAQRVGWQRSITVLKDRVRELRPLYLPPDPASRTTYVAGDRVQCDLWFPPVDIPLGHGQVGRPPVLVMVSVVLLLWTASWFVGE